MVISLNNLQSLNPPIQGVLFSVLQKKEYSFPFVPKSSLFERILNVLIHCLIFSAKFDDKLNLLKKSPQIPQAITYSEPKAQVGNSPTMQKEALAKDQIEVNSTVKNTVKNYDWKYSVPKIKPYGNQLFLATDFIYYPPQNPVIMYPDSEPNTSSEPTASAYTPYPEGDQQPEGRTRGVAATAVTSSTEVSSKGPMYQPHINENEQPEEARSIQDRDTQCTVKILEEHISSLKEKEKTEFLNKIADGIDIYVDFPKILVESFIDSDAVLEESNTPTYVHTVTPNGITLLDRLEELRKLPKEKRDQKEIGEIATFLMSDVHAFHTACGGAFSKILSSNNNQPITTAFNQEVVAAPENTQEAVAVDNT